MKRWLLLALSFAAIAFPQTRECEASAAATPLRREGQAELLSSLLLQCEGGPAVAPGAALPLATITLTFNVPVASRSLPSRVTEALLLVNEPPASAQYPCLEESCPAVNGAPLGSGAGQARNVYAAVTVGSNVLRWSNVPLPAGDFRLRFVNLRVSAPAGPVFAEVAISSATRTEVEDSPIQLGYAAGEIQFSLRDIFDRALTSPVTMSKLSGANFPITSTVGATFLVKFTETFGSALKKRAAASSGNNPTQAEAQSAPQPANLTESGTHNPALGPLGSAGLADHGTRLVARFTNIPAGVTIYVSTVPVLPGTTANIGARLLAVDANGAGPYQLQATTTVAAGGLPVAALPLSGGTATAVWEVLEPSAQSDALAFGVVVSYPATAQPEGVIQVTGGAGPAGVGTGSGPIPRFRSLAAPANAVGFISSVPRITEVTLQQGTVGEVYPAVTLTATGGNPPYRWSLESGALPAGITLSADGRISGVPQVPGSFPFAARVTDSSFAVASIGLGLVIRPAQIFLPAQVLPAGVVGTPYPATTLTAQGSGAPFTYRVSGGSLPPGLQLSTGGQIAGTPRDDGEFEFRVTVTDRTGLTYTQRYEITVAAILAIVTQTPLRSGQLGSNYGIAFRATGGVAPYTWSLSSGQVPPGLTLAVDGTLAGTPTRAGTFGFTVAVRDRGGRAVARSFTIFVLAEREDDEDENELRPQPDELKFFATVGAPAQTQPLRFPVLAAGATTLGARVETKRGGNWLTVLNAPLTPFGVAATRTYLVTANPGSLGEGTYTGTVIFTTAQRKEIEVPVTMTIRKAQPLLSVVPTGLTFTALEGGGAPPVQRIFVTNQGSGTAGF
nr:Ig domain-containing protein [Bryobacter sp.]